MVVDSQIHDTITCSNALHYMYMNNFITSYVLLMCVTDVCVSHFHAPQKKHPPFHFEKFRSSAPGMKKVRGLRAVFGVLFLDWVKKMIVATAICGGKMMKCLMKC